MVGLELWGNPLHCVKSNDGRSGAPGKPVALYALQLVFQFVPFEVDGVFSAMRLFLVL